MTLDEAFKGAGTDMKMRIRDTRLPLGSKKMQLRIKGTAGRSTVHYTKLPDGRLIDFKFKK